MSSKVFVGNLAFATTREEIQSLFSEAGEIRDVVLPSDRHTGRPRGFAFVEYETEEEAQRAIDRFDGYELGGRALRVNAAQERSPRLGSFGGDRPGFRGGRGGYGGGKSKGSRRNIRAKKRGL